MKYRLILLAAVGVGTNLISGCGYLFGNEGYFRSRSLDYQAAKEHRPLVVPPGTEVVARPEIYPIPEIRPGEYYRPKDLDDVPRPEALVSVNEDAGLEMRTDGDRQWLVANRKLSELWEDLELFFKASGIELEQVDNASQTIITAWLQPKQKEAEGFWDSFVEFFSLDNTEDLREKFRLTVTTGETVDQYNIQIDHYRVDTSDDELPPTTEIPWQQENSDPELVTAMYDEIISYLSDDEVRFRRSSLFSQNLSSQAAYLLTRDGNGYPVLVIQQEFNRAWIAVAEALAKTDLKIDDRNRSLGIFYVIYGETDEGEEAQYQIKLNRAENGIQVAVQIDDEQIAPKDVSELMIGKIKENL